MSEYLTALPPGYRLQEYELVRVLGAGGFGITYLAFDHHLEKGVAVKEYLPRDLATRTGRETVAPQSPEDRGSFEWGLARFIDEARTLAKFDHPNVVKVYRYFTANSTAYIVMEYAEGETLAERLARFGTVEQAELHALLEPILAGLEEVHRAGVQHRDIKPGNIIIRTDGSPVLLDFGSARYVVGAKSRSVTSVVTPGYAPIEQYESNGRQGPWTDVYALAAVCYRALTGDVPVDATERVRRDPLVPAVRAAAGKATAVFLEAVDWGLRVNEDARPQSVAEWRAALLGDRSVPPDEASVAGAGTPSRSMRPRTYAAVGFSALAAVAVAGYVARGYLFTPEEPLVRPSTEEQARDAIVSPAEPERDEPPLAASENEPPEDGLPEEARPEQALAEEAPPPEPTRYRFVLELQPADARVVLVDRPAHVTYEDGDGVEGVALEPGPLHVRVMRAGFEEIERRINLDADQRYAVRLCRLIEGVETRYEQRSFDEPYTEIVREPATTSVSGYAVDAPAGFESGPALLQRVRREARDEADEECDDYDGYIRSSSVDIDSDCSTYLNPFTGMVHASECYASVDAICEYTEERTVTRYRSVIRDVPVQVPVTRRECPAVVWERLE